MALGLRAHNPASTHRTSFASTAIPSGVIQAKKARAFSFSSPRPLRTSQSPVTSLLSRSTTSHWSSFCLRRKQHETAVQLRASSRKTRLVVECCKGEAEMAPIAARLGFIGAGMMAEALARGFITAGVAAGSQMSATDVSEARREVFAAMGVAPHRTCTEVAKAADVLFLAVKPNTVDSVLSEMRETLGKDKLIVSIAAGITLSALQDGAGPECRVIRVMPNICCLVGQTAAAMALGKTCTPADKDLVSRLLGSVGIVHAVDEKLLDAVTGLSGSGPAFAFAVIEAMADGGVAAGLPRDVALSLAAQTMLGAAQMVLQDGRHPGALKDAVCSPGGTSIAGIYALEQGSVRAGIMSAVIAAAKRSEEMGKKS